MDPVTMKRQDAYNISNALNVLTGGSVAVAKANVKWQYAIGKNKRVFTDEVAAINLCRSGLTAYDAQRKALCEEYCRKDSDGNMVMLKKPMGESFDIPDEKTAAFTEALALIRGASKEYAAYQSLLDEDVTLDVYLIALSVVPEGLPQIIMHALTPIIDPEK